MPPENNSPKDSPLKQIRTFQGDVAEALTRQNESLVSIQQTEALKNRMGGIPSETVSAEEHKRNGDFLYLFVGSIFLIILSLGGAWYGYGEYLKRTAPPVISIPANRFISANSEVEINLLNATRETFAAAFADKASDNPANELRHIVARAGEGELAPLLTTAQFMKALESQAPGNLVRSFDPLFMEGVIGSDPFLIIKLVSFENAYAGMLSWEPDMAEDLLPMFPSVKANDSASVFKDVIVKNKDVRMLSAEVPATASSSTTTTPVLLYSFFDNSVLIITSKLETLQILIERLTRERLSR